MIDCQTPFGSDPKTFQRLLTQFQAENPENPNNRDAAECLSKPPDRRGWTLVYEEWRQAWNQRNKELM